MSVRFVVEDHALLPAHGTRHMAFDPHAIYYGIDGERYGPVALDELRALLAEGSVGPDDYLWDEDGQDWIALRRYPALFERTIVTSGSDASANPIDFEPLAEDHPAARRLRADPAYAGFGSRLVAWILDDFVLLGPVFLWLITLENLTGMNLLEVWESSLRGATLTAEQLDLLRQFNGGVLAMRGLYWSAMESSGWQATVGKRIMGLVVTDERGHRLSLFRAVGRFVGRILCEVTFFVGYLLVFFSDRRQGLHDRIARTVVVRRR